MKVLFQLYSMDNIQLMFGFNRSTPLEIPAIVLKLYTYHPASQSLVTDQFYWKTEYLRLTTGNFWFSPSDMYSSFFSVLSLQQALPVLMKLAKVLMNSGLKSLVMSENDNPELVPALSLIEIVRTAIKKYKGINILLNISCTDWVIQY